MTYPLNNHVLCFIIFFHREFVLLALGGKGKKVNGIDQKTKVVYYALIITQKMNINMFALINSV